LAYLLASGGDVLRAQNAPGNIVGHVSDPTGQAIVGAKVTVRNSGTNVTNTFTTNGTERLRRGEPPSGQLRCQP
jgi:hypothetical protein